MPPLEHVFVVVLENQGYGTVTAPDSPAPYLRQLATDNALLTNYYGVGHVSLTNYIGMTDGEAPDTDTSSDCIAKYCVRDKRNVADQLEAAGKTWGAYMGSMLVPCQHPPLEGAPDPFQSPYATRHNPFVYYADIVHDSTRCNAHDVPYSQPSFEAMLRADTAVPNYAFVVPDNCDNSHDPICFEPPGLPESGGLAKADAWASSHLPAIIDYVNSHAGSVLFVTFDEAPPTDTTNCAGCAGPGGGHIYTVMIGHDVCKGCVDAGAYNHYSLLRTVEQGFGITEFLGLAGDAGTKPITGAFLP